MKKLFKLTTISGFGALSSGLVTFISAPFLADRFPPEIFAEFSELMSYILILTSVSAFKLDLAIQAGTSDKEVFKLIKTAVLLNIPLILPAGLIFYFSANNMLNIAYSLIIFLVLGLYNLIVGYEIFKNRITRVTIYGLIVIICSNILPIFLPINGVNSLMVSFAVGYTIPILHSLYFNNIFREAFKYHFDVSSVILKYKDFVVNSSSEAILNSLSVNLPIIILLWYYTRYEIGFYAYTLKYINYIIAFSVAVFSKPILIQLRDSFIGESYTPIRHLYVFLITIGVITGLFAFFTIDFLVNLFLPEEWVEISPYLKVLMPWMIIVSLVSPLSNVFIVYFKQYITLRINIVGTIFRFIGLILFGYLGFELIDSLKVFVVISCLMWVAIFHYSLKLIPSLFSKREVALIYISFFLLLFLYLK